MPARRSTPAHAARALDLPAHRRLSPTQEPACAPPLEPSGRLAPPLASPAQRWTAGAPSAPSNEDANAGADPRWPISAAAGSSPYLWTSLLRKGSIRAAFLENPSWFMTYDLNRGILWRYPARAAQGSILIRGWWIGCLISGGIYERRSEEFVVGEGTAAVPIWPAEDMRMCAGDHEAVLYPHFAIMKQCSSNGSLVPQARRPLLHPPAPTVLIHGGGGAPWGAATTTWLGLPLVGTCSTPSMATCAVRREAVAAPSR